MLPCVLRTCSRGGFGVKGSSFHRTRPRPGSSPRRLSPGQSRIARCQSAHFGSLPSPKAKRCTQTSIECPASLQSVVIGCPIHAPTFSPASSSRLPSFPKRSAFPIIAGVDPRVGLYASFSIAVIIALVGGRPGMISAATAVGRRGRHPAGARSRRRLSLRRDDADGRVPGRRRLLRLDLLMQYVSRSVVTGLRQRARDPDLHGAVARSCINVAPGHLCCWSQAAWRSSTCSRCLTKAVPSPLVAIVVLTVVTVYGGIDVNTVGDMGKLPTSLPVFAVPARAVHSRDPAGSSFPIR